MDIQENCTAIIFSTKAPRFERTSHEARAAAVDRGNCADQQSIRASKYLFPKKQTDRYARIAASFRQNVINFYTLPWGEGGRRILHVRNLERFQSQASEHMQAYMEAVDAFVDSAGRLIENAAIELGDYFNAADYPRFQASGWRVVRQTSAEDSPILSVTHYSGYFSMHYEIEAVASGEIAVRGIDASTRATWEAMAAERLKSQVRDAVGDVWSRVCFQVSKIAQALSDPEKTFQESTIGNLRELVDCMEGFNLEDDPALNEIAREIRAKLTIRDAETLRKDKGARAEQGREAREILGKLAHNAEGAAALRALATGNRKDRLAESAEAKRTLDALSANF